MTAPHRQTHHLHFGRYSAAGARYFLTCVTHDRDAVLLEPRNSSLIQTALAALQSSGDIDLHAGTIMPDHVHLLFTLGARLELGRVIAKFKSKAGALTMAIRWQRDGYDHRLREHEDAESYAFYIFMNPYVEGLCPLDQRWPLWICPDPSRFTFCNSLQNGEPIPPEWLHEVHTVKKHLFV